MKILIVDDEKTITDFFTQLALAKGYADIDTVTSGEEALTQVIRRRYDLITVDIYMPGASGLEIISMLRNMNPHAVIAIISGYIPDDLSSEIAGCVDVVIAKPVGIDIFNQLLDGTVQICEAMEKVRLLGKPPLMY